MFGHILNFLSAEVYFGRHTSDVTDGSIVFFPCRDNILCCGLTGIVSFKKKNTQQNHIDINTLKDMFKNIQDLCYANCSRDDLNLVDYYLGGEKLEKLVHDIFSTESLLAPKVRELRKMSK